MPNIAMESKPIIARGVIDVDTHMLAFAVHNGKQQRRGRCFLLGFAIVAGLSSVAAFRNEADTLGVAMIGVSLGFLALWAWTLPLFFRRRIRQQYEPMGKQSEEVVFEFLPDRFATQTKDSDFSLAWSAIRKWKEEQGMILLYVNDNFFHMIPVLQFDHVRRQAIRSLIIEKLGLPKNS